MKSAKFGSKEQITVARTRDVRHLKGLIGKPTVPVSVDTMKRAIARRTPGK